MSSSQAVEKLVPALCQVFGIIVIGYISGKNRIISKTHALGLSSYVTKFALPAVFFKVMMEIDFSGVSWRFVCSISIAKAIMFFITLMLTMIVTRCRNYSMAGVLTLFTTQSNDVALAYPILDVIYPSLATYIYLFAPIQLAVLNPIAYFLIEWQQHESSHDSEDRDNLLAEGSNTSVRMSIPKRILSVLLRVLLNPLFFMTVIGAVFNVIMGHQIPAFLQSLLSAMAQSFAATALFYLGFSMVGNMSTLDSKGIYIIVLGLIAKLIILPFMMRESVILMNHEPISNETSLVDMSTFAFLYGTCPTAPPVFLIASEYGILAQAIGVGLILGTFLCAPIMFIFAKIANLYVAKPDEYDMLLGSTVQDVCIFSIVCCIWTIAVMLASRKFARFPHRFTLCLVVSVLLSAVGTLASRLIFLSSWSSNSEPATLGLYLTFVIFFIGCNAARVWTFLLTLVLYLQFTRGHEFIKRYQLLFFLPGFCLPALLTAFLLIICNTQTAPEINPIFQYGRPQMALSLAVLCASLAGTLVCLTLFVRQRFWPATPMHHSTVSIAKPSDDPANSSYSGGEQEPISESSSIWHRPDSSMEEQQLVNQAQIDRHICLIILLLVTMFFGISLCVWRLVHDTPSGLYVVLEFLDGTFNFGQGVIFFALFGLDTELIVEPLKARLRNLWTCTFGRVMTSLSVTSTTQIMQVLNGSSSTTTNTEIAQDCMLASTSLASTEPEIVEAFVKHHLSVGLDHFVGASVIARLREESSLRDLDVDLRGYVFSMLAFKKWLDDRLLHSVDDKFHTQLLRLLQSHKIVANSLSVQQGLGDDDSFRFTANSILCTSY